MASRALTSGEKKLFVFSAIVLALPLGIGLFFNRINATPVVSIPPYPKAPNPNGYDLYVAAANAIVRVVPEPDPTSDTDQITDPKVRATRYSLARKTAWLNRNKKAFALFEQALKTPSLAPPARSFGSVNRGSAKIRQMARDKSVQSNARWMRGDYYGALQSGLDAVQMGHDTRRGGNLLAALVGIAIGAIGRSATSDTVERINAEQAKSAARRLEKLLAARWNLGDALTEEKYNNQAGMLEAFRTEGGWRKNFSSGAKAANAGVWQYYLVSKQQIIDDIGADYDRRIANARLPYAQKGAPLASFSDPFMKLFQRSGDRDRTSEARDLAGDQALMLRLALRAHHLENGAYPPNLKALTPKYLKTIPADPFGRGESWRYKLDGPTYVLWSIGPDGRDDGGKPIPPRHRAPIAPITSERKFQRAFSDFNGKGDVVAGVNS